jgi:hypothetical protein
MEERPASRPEHVYRKRAARANAPKGSLQLHAAKAALVNIRLAQVQAGERAGSIDLKE